MSAISLRSPACSGGAKNLHLTRIVSPDMRARWLLKCRRKWLGKGARWHAQSLYGSGRGRSFAHKARAGYILTTRGRGIASSSITAAKLAFSSYQDLATGTGSQTAFDLSLEVPSQFQKMILVHRNGLLLNEAASPANVDEYSVNLTGGAGGVTRITFGSAPSSSDKLTIRFLA